MRFLATGWADLAVRLNCGTRFKSAPSGDNRFGWYPYFAVEFFTPLGPWQRRQVSYSADAGFTSVTPSFSLTPLTLACDACTFGACVKVLVDCTAWGLWQS